ncbi:MAG: tRNA (guanosine(46)-N7)-methyltransferase TrmB [Lachnospiraceae bacterium]|nr:tRNA (guanosine(46)-N7)-methyltransferase TrmB [Lachnospiraceae bacterium]
MRLRNVRGAREEMLVNPHVIQEPKSFRGRMNEVFGNEKPIRIEVGMGKGQFITAMAAENPAVNYIGIEKYSSVLIRAIEKQEELQLSNLKFIRMDAEEITEVFGEAEVDRIYLNFSDPWPKDRHAKRRLTSSVFLGRYSQILKKDGIVEFKTDNEALFDFSVESVLESGWNLELVTRDLHHSPYAEGNIMTEYEIKFSSMGNPIYKLVASQKEGSR